MKLLYLTNARIPTEKANGIQIIKMCEAFQRQGLEVELFVPTRAQSAEMQQVKDIWSYYDVETPFRIKFIRTPDFLPLERRLPANVMAVLYYLQSLLFSFSAFLQTAFTQEALYYTRSLQVTLILCLTQALHRKKIYFEAHEFHGDPRRRGFRRKLLSRAMQWMLRHLDGMIVITRQLKTLYVSLGMPEARICVAPDGIEYKRLSFSIDKEHARKQIGIPLDKNVICYTGHLYSWKGVYVLAECSQYLPDNSVIYIVGGTRADRNRLQQFITEQKLSNIVMTGYVPYTQAPLYLGAADVLVLPNTATAKISQEYTSPLKLFEYMGARRPIAASDLPSLREILRHRHNAYLVPPDDPKALAQGIEQVLQDQVMAQTLAETAYQEVQQYTWDQRAENIRKSWRSIARLKSEAG